MGTIWAIATASQIAEVEKVLPRLNRRCERFRLTPFSIEYERTGVVFRLGIHGPTPRIGDWIVLASIRDHKGTRHVVRFVDDVPCMKRWERAPQRCDHCHNNRHRNKTLVIQHDDGMLLSVGPTCIGQVMGTNFDGTRQLTIAAEQWITITDTLSKPSRALDLLEYLAYVHAEIAENGWVSRQIAKQMDTIPTSGLARVAMMRQSRTVTTADRQVAKTALAWVSTIADDSPFVTDMKAAASIPYATKFGICAYIVEAYLRINGGPKRAWRCASKTRESSPIGVVGETVETTAHVRSVSRRASRYAHGVYCWVVATDNAGNRLAWSTATNSDRYLRLAATGEQVRVRGRVKSHGPDGRTVLQRVVLLEAS